MKKVFKFLKYLLLSVAGLAALFLAIVYIGHKFVFREETAEKAKIPDIKTDGFCFGTGCQPQSTTADQYIKVLAEQIKVYNQIAPALWPKNKVIDQYALVESIENDSSWLISPDGNVKRINMQQTKEISVQRSRFNVGFNPFEHNGIKGIYLALSEQDLKNVLSYQKYAHLGTYDMFITYCHELFHIREQDNNWVNPSNIKNTERNDRMNDTAARAKRNLLYQQVLTAVGTKDSIQKRERTLEAIATYTDYKQNFKADYEDALYLDRMEGTAFYYELVSCLYSAYPAQVNSPASLDKALTAIAPNLDRYSGVGLGIEAYWIFGWAGVLADQLFPDNKNEWKLKVMQQPNETSLTYLADKFSGTKLPEPQSVTPLEKEKIQEVIRSKQEGSRWKNLFRLLFELIF